MGRRWVGSDSAEGRKRSREEGGRCERETEVENYSIETEEYWEVGGGRS
jgi:hypothetical protein